MASDPVDRPHTRPRPRAMRRGSWRSAMPAGSPRDPARAAACHGSWARSCSASGLTTFIAVGDGHRDDDDGRRRAVGRAARPEPARGTDVLPADRRLRPVGDGRARVASSARSGASSRSATSRSWSSTRRPGPRTGRSGRTAGSTRRPSSRPRPRERAGRASAAPRRSPSSSSEPGSCRPTSPRPGSDRYMRKAKELIQAMRVSETFPGEQGKDRIITAYLNEIFYGHGAYGIAAAALIYFGVSDLAELTPGPGRAAGRAAQVALDARSVPLRRQGRRGPAGRAAGRSAGRPPRLDPRRARPRAPAGRS